MATESFVAFFNNYLPQHPGVKKTLEAIADPSEFVKALMKAGKEAGYGFSEVDVEKVLQASLREELSRNGELSSEQLEAVAGGLLSTTSIQTIQITSLASTKNAVLTANVAVSGESTWMCSH
jgi:hypothetical protein